MQLVDDSAAADFVLIDDGDAVNACTGLTAIQSIRLDPAAVNADLTVSLSRAPAAYKIYVRSASFSQQGAAALFAAACAVIAFMLMRQRTHADKVRELETRIEELSDDTWELREVEVNALAAARDLAETANRAKSRFLATVSHEIRLSLIHI